MFSHFFTHSVLLHINIKGVNYLLVRSKQNLQFPLWVNTVASAQSPSKYSQLSTSTIINGSLSSLTTKPVPFLGVFTSRQPQERIVNSSVLIRRNVGFIGLGFVFTKIQISFEIFKSYLKKKFLENFDIYIIGYYEKNYKIN